jgi:hypothetical protein
MPSEDEDVEDSSCNESVANALEKNMYDWGKENNGNILKVA